MDNIYTQMYIQFIFAVNTRENLIAKEHREELHKYFTGILKNYDQKMLAVFAMPDHVHLLAGYRPTITISDLAKNLKTGTSKFINEHDWTPRHFNWQTGYSAFSYSRKDIDRVIKYILNQEEHHKTESFKSEYRRLLNEFEIQYDEKYLFKDVLTE